MQFGIYEKALPSKMPLVEKITHAKKLGFDFLELSIDEQDFRIDRLKWSVEERLEIVSALRNQGMRIPSICLSAHRRFPLGSQDATIRHKALEILKDAIDFADDLGVRVIQLAGYDVYYETKTLRSRHYFIQGLKQAMAWAHEKQITLSIEIMDDSFINSLTRFKEIQNEVGTLDLKAYLDVGNLTAWPQNSVGYEIFKGRNDIVAVHLKDTLAVRDGFEGKFKNVAFGTGCVDFAAVLMILKEIKYQGPFLAEMWTTEDLNKDLQNIKEAKEFLESAFKESGWIV